MIARFTSGPNAHSMMLEMTGSMIVGAGDVPPVVTEHIQNGDMLATAGWSPLVPVAGALIVGPATLTDNTLSVPLSAGPATLKYIATVESGAAFAVTVTLRNGGGLVQTLPQIMSGDATGVEKTVPLTITGSGTIIRISEGDGDGSLSFTKFSITTST